MRMGPCMYKTWGTGHRACGRWGGEDIMGDDGVMKLRLHERVYVYAG